MKNLIVMAMAGILALMSLAGCKGGLFGPLVTNTPTPNRTETAIATVWTKTSTITPTQTLTVSHTRTITRTQTHSRTITQTRSVTPTFTITRTFTSTPTSHVIMVFSSDAGGVYHIAGVGEGGAVPVDLTGNTANDKSPLFSPDGAKIAFVREWAPAPDIYVMGAAGQGQVNITNSSADYGMISWSPDSSKLAYYNSGVCTVDAAGGAKTFLAAGWAPSWSPNSQRIAYFAQPGGQNDIFVMDADGNGNTRLTYTGGVTAT